MNKKLKLMMFALGVGISAGAVALPTAKICDNWCNQCNAGDQLLCDMWNSGRCSTAGGSCFPM